MTTNESIEPALPPETADPQPEPEAVATDPPRPRRRTRLTVTLAVVLLAIGVTVVVLFTGGHNSRDTPAGGRATPPKVTASPGTGKSRAGAVSGSPSADPSDPWQGFGVLSDTDPAVIMKQLASRWSLVFEKVPRRGGTTEMGVAGDMTRKGRRLDGAVTFDADNRIRSVLCQAGGTEVNLVGDEVNQQFLYDCLGQAVHGPEWTSLKAWLDDHLAQLRTGGDGNYDSKAIRLEMRSDGHFMRVAATGK